MSPRWTHRLAWDPEWTKLLGKQSDRSLAKQIGANPRVVSRRRKLAGIAEYDSTTDMADRLRRFREKYAVAPSGCWLWHASCDRKGYAQLGVGATVIRAHRVSYEMFVGPIPDGLEIDHLCRVRNCVNPEHLEAVTHTENIARRPRLARTHCMKGHPYTPDNTLLVPDGGRNGTPARHCLTCKRAFGRKYWRQRKESAGAAQS